MTRPPLALAIGAALIVLLEIGRLESGRPLTGWLLLTAARGRDYASPS